MTCPFALDDGAYLLGALAPAERAGFEHHLPLCPPCRDAVAALAVLPGLLRRLDPTTAVVMSPAPTGLAPQTLLPRTLAAAAEQRSREHRRRRWRAVAAAAAAVCLAAVVGFAVHAADAIVPQPELTAMQPVWPAMPISGEVGLTPVDGGTRVELTCRYDSGYEGQWTVYLVVYPRSGGPAEQISTWMASSGREITVQAMTHLPPEQIGRVELQRGDNTAVLTWSAP